ncbi:HIT family protein [Candidatus Nomurabacteria bacterium]|nr:HIT family protein [Candidatus Nomurabacteria bacterium]
MNKASCLVCSRIESIHSNKNPYYVTELPSGYVVLGDHQLFKGYSLLLLKNHVQELHELIDNDRRQFLEDMSLLGKAINNAFSPEKINYELLGNSANHLHWHIFPRHKNDPRPQGPVWAIDKAIRYSEEYIPKTKTLQDLKNALLSEINKLKS